MKHVLGHLKSFLKLVTCYFNFENIPLQEMALSRTLDKYSCHRDKVMVALFWICTIIDLAQLLYFRSWISYYQTSTCLFSYRNVCLLTWASCSTLSGIQLVKYLPSICSCSKPITFLLLAPTLQWKKKFTWECLYFQIPRQS